MFSFDLHFFLLFERNRLGRGETGGQAVERDASQRKEVEEE